MPLPLRARGLLGPHLCPRVPAEMRVTTSYRLSPTRPCAWRPGRQIRSSPTCSFEQASAPTRRSPPTGPLPPPT
eukprot:scaffold16054_cov127-Isochrysis_galbana.AAC.6